VDPQADRETVYETYDAIEVTPWFIVSPHVQIVTSPGGGKEDRNAVVADMRARAGLGARGFANFARRAS
jgi:carbohydrate-selective porin OprB